ATPEVRPRRCLATPDARRGGPTARRAHHATPPRRRGARARCPPTVRARAVPIPAPTRRRAAPTLHRRECMFDRRRGRQRAFQEGTATVRPLAGRADTKHEAATPFP